MIWKLLRICFYMAFLIVLAGAAFFYSVYVQVAKETSELINKGAIENIIFSESPVYYDDGVTPIGVFFENTHNKYISYDEIPKVYIKALIASEDKNFFKHHGFDISAIARAFAANMKAGKVVQGGSTITQQTAKNVFYREKKTYIIKLKELIQALLIEKNIQKKKFLRYTAINFL